MIARNLHRELTAVALTLTAVDYVKLAALVHNVTFKRQLIAVIVGRHRHREGQRIVRVNAPGPCDIVRIDEDADTLAALIVRL
ncbi:hypothetical protein D3C73_1470860 [compost metagenome]